MGNYHHARWMSATPRVAIENLVGSHDAAKPFPIGLLQGQRVGTSETAPCGTAPSVSVNLIVRNRSQRQLKVPVWIRSRTVAC